MSNLMCFVVISMLLRFGCENYRSVDEYQELYLTSTSKKVAENKQSFYSKEVNSQILPVIAIYGANASGKTNFISALRFMIRTISFAGNNRFSRIRAPRFKFSEDEKPSSFDIDFLCEGVHYHYGFSLDSDKVQSEYLYSFSYGKRLSRSMLFERFSGDTYKFGKSLKGNNKAISKITSETGLFLSVSAMSGHETLSVIHDYFSKVYSFRFNTELDENEIGKKLEQSSYLPKISKFLTGIDVGASNISVNKVEVDEKSKELDRAINSLIASKMEIDESILPFGKKDFSYEIYIERVNSKGQKNEFRFGSESLGTRALVSLLSSVFSVLEEGGVFVVDEIESSLHTLLTQKIVELFSSLETNKNGAQLIFTTHETDFLTVKKLPIDSVWIAEKNLDNSTQLFALSDYKIQKNSNIQKGYLEGRFGGIPNLDFETITKTLEDA